MSHKETGRQVLPLRRRIARDVFRSFVELTSRGIKVEGVDNLPKSPPYLIAFNHTGWVEGLVPYFLLPDDQHWPYTITKEKTLEGVLGPLLKSLGFIGIKRGEVDRQALRRATEELHAGHVIAGAPEGTRGRGDERLQPKNYKAGLIYLARQFAPPLQIVPIAIWGQNELTFPLIDEEGINLRDFRNLRRLPQHIRIGKPFIPVLENEINLPRHQVYSELSIRLANEILGLLPKERQTRVDLNKI